MHTIILINGLGGEIKPLTLATNSWKKYGFTILVFHVDWKDKKVSFENILNNLVKKIDTLSSEGNTISIIGCSAGASLALNAFLMRTNKIKHAVNICGPVRIDNHTGLKLRSVSWWKNISPLLIDSLNQLESRLSQSLPNEKSRIMTIRAGFGDELVPPGTVTVPGAENIKIPTIEHTLSIYLALILFKQKIIKFLNAT